MRTVGASFLIVLALFMGVGTTWGILHAADVSGALYTITARWTNTGATNQDDIPASFVLSGAGLIDQNLLAGDALNAALQKGGIDQPGMPPTTRIDIEGVVLKSGASFVEYTSEAQEDTENDVPLLPTSPVVDDALYFGCDNPCRILTVDTDTAGVNDLTLAYEYWDGDTYEPLSGVTDNTNRFTTLGRETVSWDMPADWATSTVTGSAVTSFWGRARISAVTSYTTQPLGSRLFYENGEWWTWLEDLDIDTQEQYTLYLGGDDMLTSHQIFPGAAGITTADDATIEVTGNYVFGFNGRMNFSGPSASDCVICKSGAITVNVSGAATAPALGATITGTGGTTVMDMTGITLPDTGTQWVILASNGTDLVLLADAGGGLEFGDARAVVDNANSWEWASNGSTDYLESVRVRAAAPTVMNVDRTYTQWNTGTQTNTQAYTGVLGLDNQ